MIIDFRVRVPRKMSGASTGQEDFLSRYNELMNVWERSEATVEDLIEQMDQAGVDKAVLHAEFEFGNYRELNDLVGQLVKKYPDRFFGFGSVDPRDGMKAVYEVDRIVKELGLHGLNLQPFVTRLPANDKRYYPLYARCVEYDIPVGVHTGVNYSTDRIINLGHPMYLDEVLCDFPGLKLVALHAGWPWLNEMVAIARKHPSLYLETGGWAPKYIGETGTGWEIFFRYAKSILQDQILFGTDWPVVQFSRAVPESLGLNFDPKVKDKFLYKNCQKLLGL